MTTAVATRRPIVVQGRRESLADIPFHTEGPLTRWLMASRDLDPALGVYVAVHDFAEVPQGDRDYCQPHVHEYDELNVYHTASRLVVEVRLGDDVQIVEAPATVFIPAGVPHAANVKTGSGFMVAVLFGGAYRATAPDR